MLRDSQKTPQELIILGRQLNIVRANNAAMGSPANRVAIMANAAARYIHLRIPPPPRVCGFLT